MERTVDPRQPRRPGQRAWLWALLALACAVALAAGGALVALRSNALGELARGQARIAYGYRVEKELGDITEVLRAAEFQERTYLASGLDVALREFRLAERQLPGEIEEARALLLDDPLQSSRLERVAQLVRARLEDLDAEVSLGAPTPMAASWSVRDKEIVSSIQIMLDDQQAAVDGEQQRLYRSIAGNLEELLFAVATAALTVVAVIGVLLLTLRRRSRVVAEASRARERAEAASEAKNLYLASVSHEIRSPLGVIVGYGELLADPSLSEAARLDMLATIRRNSDHLNHLVGETLDYAKIESGTLSLEAVPVSLTEVADDLRAMFAGRAAEKGVGFAVRLGSDVPGTVVSDPTRLRQVLTNLVGNAVKFTSQGSVTLTASRGDGVLAFTVTDTGRGLSEAERARIFQPFSQASAATRREYGGAGLGLSLARQLARALGGDVVLAASTSGQGSTFVATIACTEAADSPKPDARRTYAGAELH